MATYEFGRNAGEAAVNSLYPCDRPKDAGKNAVVPGMKILDVIKLVIAVGLSLSAGAFGSVFTTRSDFSSWYDTLNKPFFNPPGWVFGPVWTALYILMGIAAFVIWREGLQRRAVRIGLACFTLQLVLNTLWSAIFFGMHRIDIALIEIVVLWAAIAATIVTFRRVSRTAAILLYPYILWVSFAVVLNASIWVLNR